MFQLYSRALHPELFQVYKQQRVERGDWTLEVKITTAGHVVNWRHKELTLTEVACSAQHPLPQQGRLFSHALRGEQQERVECRSGVHYQTTFQLEQVPADVFWTFQQELTADGQKRGILYTFDSSGRMAMGALSYIHVETRSRSMLVQAFHTFPDDQAIVKSQSLVELG